MNYDQDTLDRPREERINSSSGVVVRGRRCTFCRRTMPPGTLYTKACALIDGQFQWYQGCATFMDECPLGAT